MNLGPRGAGATRPSSLQDPALVTALLCNKLHASPYLEACISMEAGP